MDNDTQKFLDEAQERLKTYFGTPDRPVVLMRAETDLLVRLLVSYHSVLSIQLKHWKKKGDSAVDKFDDLAINANLTDIAIIGSISGKLRESEDR